MRNHGPNQQLISNADVGLQAELQSSAAAAVAVWGSAGSVA